MNSLGRDQKNMLKPFGHFLSAGVLVMTILVITSLAPIPLLPSPCAAAPSPFPKPPKGPPGWMYVFAYHGGRGGYDQTDANNFIGGAKGTFTGMQSEATMISNIMASKGSTNYVTVSVWKGNRQTGASVNVYLAIRESDGSVLFVESVGPVIYDVSPDK